MVEQLQIGLKLFSTNTELIEAAKELWEKKVFAYIELYIIPTSFGVTIRRWKELNIPIVIHAPHSFHGMNLARSEQASANRGLFSEVQQFADALQAEIIIVHGGHTGTIEETIAQVQQFGDPRIFLENKPKKGLHGEICVGYSPGEFTVAAQSGVFGGYVLDFGHAACAALSMGKKTAELVDEFTKFDPGIFHISDGHRFLEEDSHLNFEKGSYDLSLFMSFFLKNKKITIETPRNPETGLDDFVKDVQYLTRCW